MKVFAIANSFACLQYYFIFHNFYDSMI